MNQLDPPEGKSTYSVEEKPPSSDSGFHLGIALYRVVLQIMPSCLGLAAELGFQWIHTRRHWIHLPGWVGITVFLFLLASIAAIGFWDACLSRTNESRRVHALKFTIGQCLWLFFFLPMFASASASLR